MKIYHIKTKILWAALCLTSATVLPAATNELTTQLQQGLFDEEASHNLNAAIADYQSLAREFDQDREVAATAIYRLGECYRKLGKTNEAAVQYERIIRDFSDEKELATLSRQNLTGLGLTPQSTATVAGANALESTNSTPSGSALAEAELLAAQLSGLEQLKDDPEKRARAVLALFPDEELKDPLLRLTSKEEQAAGAAGTNSTDAIVSRSLLARATRRVDFILGLQRARLQVLQAGAGLAAGAGKNSSPTTAADPEAEEIQRIQTMIQNSPDLINAPPLGGITPLGNAATEGQMKVAAFLLDHGAGINVDQGNGLTALGDAARAGNRAMVELLLSRGADVNVALGNAQTPLMMAAEKGFQTVVGVLLANQAEVNATDAYQGNTALHLAVQKGWSKIVPMLLTAGGNPNVVNKSGRTPLGLAAEGKFADIVKLLLAAKADANDGKGWINAPLLGSIFKNDLESAELLLRAGADPNKNSSVDSEIARWVKNYNQSTPLMLAVSMNKLSMVQLLLKFKADPNDEQMEARTVTFNALPYPDILAALLDAGARVDARDQNKSYNITNINQSLLNAAVAYKKDGSVEALLKHGANPNTADGYGNTPLHEAAKDGADSEISALLLEHGANPNVQNNQAQTPLDLLKTRMGHPASIQRSAVEIAAEQFASLLRQHGAMDHLPDWDRIIISRPLIDFSSTVLYAGTNDWNQLTLLEMLLTFYESPQTYSVPQGNGSMMMYTADNIMRFPDLGHIVIVRPEQGSTNETRITVNLLGSTNGLDFDRDVPVKAGDVIEIPERDHALGDQPVGLTENQRLSLENHLKGKVMLLVHGQKVELPIYRFGFDALVKSALGQSAARNLLLASSDLSRVKVTRHDPKTGKISEWTVDCRTEGSPMYHFGGSSTWNMGSGGDVKPLKTSDLWLRDGDIIEVPEKL